MPTMFQEDRATQVAALLLKLSGGKINRMKLIKLMYLVERGAIVRWGRPVTFDWLISMKHGPVLSATLDCINDEPPGEGEEPTYWQRYISAQMGYDIRLLSEAPADALSTAEVELINEVFTRFGHMDQFQLRDWCHANLPEWKDPGPTRKAIDLADILRAEQVADEDIEEILAAISAEKLAHALLA